MKLTITIDMDNAAFEDRDNETAWIIRKLADKIDTQGLPTDADLVFDSNGNRVGIARVSK